MAEPIEIDGSFNEGGGQIIRTSLALSALTSIPFHAVNIRKGRKISGLKSQHMYSIKALKKICNAEIENDNLGSESLSFIPSNINGGNYQIDVKTAGSISLVLQTLLPILSFADKKTKLTIIGGTHGKWSPPIEYFSEILLPNLYRLAEINYSLKKRGYFPKGGGEIEIQIKPKIHRSDYEDFSLFQKAIKKEISSFNYSDKLELIKLRGISHASIHLEKASVAERQVKSAKFHLKNKYNCPIDIDINYSDTLSIGSGITLWAELSENENVIDPANPIRLGADSLGEQGKKSEIVGEVAAKSLIKEIDSNASVDKYQADQLLIFMALQGNSRIKTSEITNHTKTNIYTIEQFLGKTFQIDEENNTIKTL